MTHQFTMFACKNMFFKGSCLILSFLALVTFGADPTPSFKPGTLDPCQEFLVDQCVKGTEDNPQVEVLHDVAIMDCDFFCNTVYASNCTFYIQDKKQNICEIWKIKNADYEKDCVKHEGPDTPALRIDGSEPLECTLRGHKCNVRHD